MNNVTLHYNLCAGDSLRTALLTAQELGCETGLEPDSISYTDGSTDPGGVPIQHYLRYDRLCGEQVLLGRMTIRQYVDHCAIDA